MENASKPLEFLGFYVNVGVGRSLRGVMSKVSLSYFSRITGQNNMTMIYHETHIRNAHIQLSLMS